MNDENAPTAQADRLFMPAEPKPAISQISAANLLGLQAFEAAYRLGSFRAAADALHLTPSAVSHRIRNLERLMGDHLFVRAHRAVTPTVAGRSLAATTGRAFTEFARALSLQHAPGARTRLRLAVVPTFEMTWLIPRIETFLSAHPEVELLVENVNRALDFDNEPFDAAICGGTGDWPGLAALPLMKISTTPICAPAVAARLKFRHPIDLQRATLVHVTSYPLAWSLWFDSAGIGEITPRRTFWVDSFWAAQQAAECGVGVALGLDPLCAEPERLGRLQRPFPMLVPTGDYWFVHRPQDERNPALRAFKRWIIAAAEPGEVAIDESCS
ncbi:MAG: LysR family transcriptional regulator [Sphingopyxis sp.]|nr:LysR family transcriptional regulator [Sphingopyxis sp.]